MVEKVQYGQLAGFSGDCMYGKCGTISKQRNTVFLAGLNKDNRDNMNNILYLINYVYLRYAHKT